MRRKERGRVPGVQYFTVFVGHKHTAQLRNNNISSMSFTSEGKVVVHK